jgi:DNA-binding CsgD family transcriptional regulator
VAEATQTLLDSTRLLFDLQRVSTISQTISGCLNPETIAQRITHALVEQFDCAFARIWLVNPDRTALRLVASAGMYSHINGSFAHVPMGAYKVGKIAQNRVPFLSNQLADESWVKDRAWAVANHIQGFAGYPLAIGDRVIGVLAAFSHHRFAPEFLEVLQVLCLTTTIALDAALTAPHPQVPYLPPNEPFPLSDQLAMQLRSTRLTLVGTEQLLPPSLTYLFLKTAEILNQLNCHYCRLTYETQIVALDAIVSIASLTQSDLQTWLRWQFDDLRLIACCLSGQLQTQVDEHQPIVQVLLSLPYPFCPNGTKIHIQSHLPALQLVLTQLAHQAGLTVVERNAAPVLLLTDMLTTLEAEIPVIWVQHHSSDPVPSGVAAMMDLAIQPLQFREIVEKVLRGDVIKPGINPQKLSSKLSDREHKIMTLLTQGLRDRDIAQQLFISESTVKFHINNSLTKLNAKNRYQAVYQAAIHGWI